MDRLLALYREYPVLAAASLFAGVSLLLFLLLGGMMRRAGVSLKPLVFFFGFLALVAGPQGVVHLLDAAAHHRAVAQAPAAPAAASPTPAPPAALHPVPWKAVFGPQADPDLITDARKGLAQVLEGAEEAKLSFSKSGESALAARFASPAAAAAALNRYGTFFQFGEARGSDAEGWTARRYEGQGEWNHVVTAGAELYAWTGASREAVEARRDQALGHRKAAAPARLEPAAAEPSRTQVSGRLAANTPVMVGFLVVNVLLAATWFFKASEWAARVEARPGVSALSRDALWARLLAAGGADSPSEARVLPDGRGLEITWRYGEARWLDQARLHGQRRAHRLVLTLDARAHRVRVREYWSALDPVAGPAELRFHWQAARGIQFFQVEHQRVAGVQLDSAGRPTGALSSAYTFNLQELKAPYIEAVTGAGWTWQPVM